MAAHKVETEETKKGVQLFKQTQDSHLYRPDAITLNMHPFFTNITANHRYHFRVSINLKQGEPKTEDII